MINRIWTILNRGTKPTSPYGRKTAPYLFNASWPNQRALDILVPLNGPVLERHFRIEQLVQGVLRSAVREAALELDLLNTYEQATITYPEVGFHHDSPYTPFFSEGADEGESFSVQCELNPGALTFTVDGTAQAVTITSDLTNLLELPNESQVRFRGPFSGAAIFTIAYTPRLKVPWMNLLHRLEDIEILWPNNALRDVWMHDYLWLNRVSAVVMAIATGE